MFEEIQVEIAPLAENLFLGFQAQFYEDELAEVPAESIVYSGETYYVKVDWWFYGNLALTRHFCGTWRVKIDLESVGVAPEYTSDVVEVDMDPCNMGTEENPYTHTFALTPGDVQPHEDGTVYLVAVTLATHDVCGDPGHIWGYGTGPSVMFVAGSPHEDDD
jgi:hypothetical protein